VKNLKIPKKLIVLIVVIVITIFAVSKTTLGRYIYNSFNNHILESQNFYFNSSILTPTSNTYSISNWDGVNSYILTIDVNGKKNELISTDIDIKYDIDIICPETVSCTLNKEKGIIDKTLKTDNYIITITPLKNFYAGDFITLTTSATSIYPYTKKLSATYIISVENYGFSYEIKDEVGSKYLTLELTNSKPYYEVKESFLDYSVGDYISLSEYEKLTNEQKQKCVSKRVTVSFDPNELMFDMTDDIYINNNTYTTRNINGYDYIDSISFNILANYNEKILLYKKDINKSYDINNSSIVVSVEN